MLIPTLHNRHVVPELMDAPDLDPAAHGAALAGLERINRVSHASEQLALPIVAMAQAAALTRLRVLDVACGGGDVSVGVAQAALQHGLTIELTLVDKSETALSLALNAAEKCDIVANAISGEAPAGLPPGTFDIVMSSLFLHHLDREAVIETLRQMRQRAARLVLVSDLRRSMAGFLVAWTSCRLLTRSAIVHHDGPASVRAAWSIDEMRDMAHAAGMQGVRITRSWPWRMLLVWRREEAGNAPCI